MKDGFIQYQEKPKLVDSENNQVSECEIWRLFCVMMTNILRCLFIYFLCIFVLYICLYACGSQNTAWLLFFKFNHFVL